MATTYLYNKNFKVFISFLLVFLVLLNFGLDIYKQKVYAEALLLGIATKIILTILSAMGVLAFVNTQKGGYSAFVDGLLNHMEKVQGVTNALGLFVKLGKDIIVDKAKLGASSLVQTVKDYYNSVFKKTVSSGLSSYLIKDTFKFNTTAMEVGTHFNTFGLARGSYMYRYLPSGVGLNSMPVYDVLMSNNDYVYSLGNNYYATVFFTGLNSGVSKLSFEIYYADHSTKKASLIFSNDIISFFKAKYNNFVSSVSFEYSAKTNEFYFSNSLFVHSLNETFVDTKVLEVPVLTGLDKVVENSFSVPTATSVDRNLDWGWQVKNAAGEVVDSLGKTTAEVFEKVNESVDDFAKALERAGTKVNDIKSGEIVVENDVVVDVIYPDLTGIFDKVNEGIGEQTGILTGILTGITGISDWLKDLFSIDTNYMNTKVMELEGIVNNKIGSPNFAPLTGLFSSIKCVPIPSNKYVDTSVVNSIAVTVREWQRFFWTVILFVFGVNKIYKLIRKDNFTDMKNADK